MCIRTWTSVGMQRMRAAVHKVENEVFGKLVLLFEPEVLNNIQDQNERIMI